MHVMALQDGISVFVSWSVDIASASFLQLECVQSCFFYLVVGVAFAGLFLVLEFGCFSNPAAAHYNR